MGLNACGNSKGETGHMENLAKPLLLHIAEDLEASVRVSNLGPLIGWAYTFVCSKLTDTLSIIYQERGHIVFGLTLVSTCINA